VEKRLFADLDPTCCAGPWRATRRIRSRAGGAGRARSFLDPDLPDDRHPLPARHESARGAPAPDGRGLKAAWHELDTGHYPMLSQPEELTRLLLAPVS